MMQRSRIISRRWNSTSSVLDQLYDEHLVRRTKELEKYLSGRPFKDNIKLKHVKQSMNDYNSSMIVSPYISLDAAYALKEIYSKESSFVNVKNDSLNEFNDKFDIMLDWKHRFGNTNLKQIPFKSLVFNLKFPEELKNMMMMDIENGVSIEESVQRITSTFGKYTYENVVLLYVKLIPEAPEQFGDRITEFLAENIVSFRDSTVEEICRYLLKFGMVPNVTTIINQCDLVSHTDVGFTNILSPFFLSIYLKSLIKSKDMLNSNKVLEKLIQKGHKPEIAVIQDYIKLSRDITLTLSDEATKEKLFNLLNVPVLKFVAEDIFNYETLNCIAEFIPLNQLTLFINYLKLTKGYSENAAIPLIVVNKMMDSEEFGKLRDQEKSIFLTAILSQLERDLFNDEVIAKIIQLYSASNSTLGVLNYYNQLKDKSIIDRNDLLDTFEIDSNNVSSKIDISSHL